MENIARFSPRSARTRRRRRRRWKRNVSLVPGLPGLTVRWRSGRERERWETPDKPINNKIIPATERNWEEGLHERVN